MNPSRDLPWVIVGYGRVGQSLALLARRIDANVKATWNRTEQAANGASVSSPNPRYGELDTALTTVFKAPALVWLTVVDDAISSCFDSLVDALSPGSIIVHTSGSLPSTILNAPPDVSVASLHPLLAISDPRTALHRFSRCHWTVEGDDDAVEFIEALLAPQDIVPLRIPPQHKILYHASAVTAANLLVSLFDAAITMAETADIDADKARQMLVELGQSSLENLADRRPKEALTGPVSRGDQAVIERHRRALGDCDDPTLLEIYDLLTQRALDRLSD